MESFGKGKAAISLLDRPKVSCSYPIDGKILQVSSTYYRGSKGQREETSYSPLRDSLLVLAHTPLRRCLLLEIDSQSACIKYRASITLETHSNGQFLLLHAADEVNETERLHYSNNFD